MTVSSSLQSVISFLQRMCGKTWAWLGIRPELTLGSQMQKEVVLDQMMSQSQIRHTHADLLVHTNSSDPTNKNISPEPRTQTSPVSARTLWWAADCRGGAINDTQQYRLKQLPSHRSSSMTSIIKCFTESHLPFLEQLPDISFKTITDGICWTPLTAIPMANHWCS